jgi:hypothetical protein
MQKILLFEEKINTSKDKPAKNEEKNELLVFFHLLVSRGSYCLNYAL